MNEIFKRLTLPSPSFFKKVQWFGVVIGAIGGGLMAINQQFPDTVVVGFLAKYAKEFVAIGAVIALVAKLPVADPNQLNK